MKIGVITFWLHIYVTTHTGCNSNPIQLNVESSLLLDNVFKGKGLSIQSYGETGDRIYLSIGKAFA